jgi:ribosomal protein S18 acetylase RimI-like enzyme
MLEIKELKAPPSLELFSELVELLQDSVNGGASVGWTQVPSTKEARNYWTEVLEAVGRGERLLFVATDNHVCAGAIQVAFAPRQNARHRGEVQKLMVHSQYRRRGIGKALVGAIEKAAAAKGLTLLVLDVRSGDDAERLYKRCGFQYVGSIPGFVQSATGAFEPTSVYYRRLGAGAKG